MDDRKWWTVSDKSSRPNGTKRGRGPWRLPVLKNGPLCLAVYGGRDLAGLSSTDSHRGWTRQGGEGWNPWKLAPILAHAVDFFCLLRFLPSLPCFRSFCPLLFPAGQWQHLSRRFATLTSDPSQWPGISWQQRCGHRIALTLLTPVLAYPAWLADQPTGQNVAFRIYSQPVDRRDLNKISACADKEVCRGANPPSLVAQKKTRRTIYSYSSVIP